MKTKITRGFTLLELIIYMGIVGLMITAVASISFDIQKSRARFMLQSNLHHNVSRMLNTVDYLVRNADGFVDNASGQDCYYNTNKIWLYYATSSVRHLPYDCMGSYQSGAVSIEPYAFPGYINTDSITLRGFSATKDNTFIYIGSNSNFYIEKRYLADLSLKKDFGTEGQVYSSSGNTVYGLATDGQYLYAAGIDNSTVARLEKRRVSDGHLCDGSTDVCDGVAFDSDGVYSGSSDVIIRDVAVDNTYVYTAGHKRTWVEFCGCYTYYWHIQKHRKDTGALETAFDSDGILTYSGTSSSLYGIAIDNTSMYLVGDYSSGWQIRKIALSNGAADTSFATNGIYTGNVVTTAAVDIEIDNTHMYVSGSVDTTSYTRVEKITLSTGSLVWSATSSSSKNGKLAIDKDYIYTANDINNTDWQLEKRSKNDGALVASFGTDGVLTPPSATYGTQKILADDQYIYIVGDNNVGFNDGWYEKRFKGSGAYAKRNGIQLICFQDWPNKGKPASCTSDPTYSGYARSDLTDPSITYVGPTDFVVTTTTVGSRQAIEAQLTMGFPEVQTTALGFNVSTTSASTTAVFRVTNP